MAAFEEQRGFCRIPLGHLDVRALAPGRPAVEGCVSDLSMSGAFVLCAEALPPGSACGLELRLAGGPDAPRFEARAEVVRVDAGGMSVRFTELPLGSYERLRTLILLHAPDLGRAEAELRAHLGIRKRG